MPRTARKRKRGIFSHVRKYPPWTPPGERKGPCPLTPPLPVCSLKRCSACRLHSCWQLCCLTDVAYPLRVIRCLPRVGAIRLGLLLSSLPLCLRIAPLTQSPPTLDLCSLAFACQGGIADARRDICAIDSRRLGCTCTRSAERQRIIEAEANRFAALNAASPRVGSRIPEA